jgi:gliding motility-associated protein GldC
MQKTSEIIFKVELDEKNLPEKITWKATDLNEERWNECKSMMLSLWDHAEKNTMRIDLWTKDFTVDEMDQHFFQTLMTMAESYTKATGNSFLVNDMKQFCNQMAAKISEEEKRKNN